MSDNYSKWQAAENIRNLPEAPGRDEPTARRDAEADAGQPRAACQNGQAAPAFRLLFALHSARFPALPRRPASARMAGPVLPRSRSHAGAACGRRGGRWRARRTSSGGRSGLLPRQRAQDRPERGHLRGRAAQHGVGRALHRRQGAAAALPVGRGPAAGSTRGRRRTRSSS